MPLALGFVATIVVLGLWQQLLGQEQRYIQQLVQQEAHAVESALSRELSARILALDRMAHRWQVHGGTPQALWEADAAQHIEHFYGYQAIEWLDPSLHVRWVVPFPGNEAVQNLDLSQEPRRYITLHIAHDLRQTLLTRTISLAQGGKGFLVCVPLFVAPSDTVSGTERFDGFILGVFRYQTLFDSLLPTSPRYTIQIYDHTDLVYSQGTALPAAPSVPAIVQAYGADWQVQVAPTSLLLREGRSPLPNLVLWGGFITAWTLALTVHLSQRSGRYARRVKQINQQLQDEIMHRQRADTSLQQGEAKYRTLINHLNVGFVVHAADTQILQCNGAACELLGLSKAQMLGKMAIDPAWHFVREDGTAMPVADYPVNRVLSTQAPLKNYVLGINKGAGSQAWVLVSAFPEFDAQRQLNQVVVIFIDISEQLVALRERKRAEIALVESQQRYQALAENSPDIIERFDLQLRHLYVSPALTEITGIATEVFLGKTCRELGMDLAMVNAWEAAAMALLETQQKQVIEFSVPTLQGVRDFEMAIAPELSDQQRIESILCISRDITERKRVEAALRQSEEKFRMAIDFTFNWEYWQGPDDTFIYVSPSCERITEYSPDELIQDPSLIHRMIHPDDRLLFAHHHCGVGSDAGLVEFRIITRSGNVRWIAHTCQSVFGHQGTYLGRRASNQDISDRKHLEFERQQAEAALRQSEATNQAIIQAIPDLLMRMRADGRDVDFISNSSFNIIHADQIRQRVSVYDVLPTDLAQRRMYYVQHALGSGLPQIYEQEILNEGKQRYEEVRIVPLSQGDVLVMVRDITDRKQAEEDLRHQKEMFQAIVDRIPVMIVLFNKHGHVEFVNPELEKVLGWSLAEWQQQDMLARCYPDATYRQGVIDHMLAASDHWKDMVTLTATGQLLETCWANVRLSQGRFLGIGQDISDRKHREMVLQQSIEAAEAANLAKSIFLANMSHELRTPLNVILGFTQVMAHDTTLTPHQRQDLQTIRRSGDYLLRLINDVLDLSKIESGHYTLETTAFDLPSFLRSLQNMLMEQATSKGIPLDFKIAPEVPQFIMADDQKLRQVLLNLLSNAIKFTNQGSVVLHVTCQASGDVEPDRAAMLWLQFDVMDTGVGIAPEDLALIFDAFVQASAGKQVVSGTGLGLTISRKLLELMGGEISVQSTLGQGSTFTFTLPVCLSSAMDVTLEPSDRLVIGLVPGQQRRRILVVDDQRENRLLLVRLLMHIGLEVREATNGYEAIQIWQDWQPDLTWMDIRMPGLDGYEATRQIRAMEQGPASVIIALTAQASESDRTLALAIGCDDYLSKPFREETLFLKLKEHLGLEYLYAEPTAPSPAAAVSFPLDNAWLQSLDSTLLATLSAEWLRAAEDAAICGYDGAIAHLAKQLPPPLAPLAHHLTELAGNYQFEQILHVLHRLPPYEC